MEADNLTSLYCLMAWTARVCMWYYPYPPGRSFLLTHLPPPCFHDSVNKQPSHPPARLQPSFISSFHRGKNLRLESSFRPGFLTWVQSLMERSSSRSEPNRMLNKVPASVLLLKPAACLSAAAVRARPLLFLRPCCRTASNCAHKQITLQGQLQVNVREGTGAEVLRQIVQPRKLLKSKLC